MTLIAVAMTALPGLVVGSVLVDGSALVLDWAPEEAEVDDVEVLEVSDALEVVEALEVSVVVS